MARDYAPATAVCPYGENSVSSDSKYGGSFCDSTGVPAVSEPEKVSENRMWVSLGHCLQRENNGFVTRGIRTVMVNRSAQVQTPAGLTDTESKCRYQMSDQLTLKGWF